MAAQARELAAAVGADFVDPARHERVVFDFVIRGVWGDSKNHRMPGWRDPKTGSLFLDDGFAVPPSDSRNVEVSALPDPPPSSDSPASRTPDGEPDVFAMMDKVAIGVGGEPRVPLAAWRAAAGETDQAVAWLAGVSLGENQTALARWRGERVWFHYAAMVHAFMQGEDAVALAHGQFLESRYPALAAEQHPQARLLMTELRRRQIAPPVLAAERIRELPADRQAAAWIARLQEVAVLQGGQPGGVDFSESPEVQALIAIGEAAIPALLDCFEQDMRLTRSVHFWRDFATSRTVLSVPEAALTAIMSILRTSFFSDGFTGDNLTSRGEDERAHVARELRAYWRRHGRSPFEQRMMALLTNRDADPETRREAAVNLATPHARETRSTTFGTGTWQNAGGPNPWLGKFESPTIHEAMLAALDDEVQAVNDKAEHARQAGAVANEKDFPLASSDGRPAPVDTRYEIRQAVRFFAAILGELGDTRAAAPLTERAATAADPALRAAFAQAAHQLGDADAVTALCRLVVSKELSTPEPGDSPAFAALYAALGAHSQSRRDGLGAIARGDHPWFPLAVETVAAFADPFGDRTHGLSYDPWCLTVLEEALSDTRAVPESDSEASWGSPARLDEATYDRSWYRRRCDQAAATLLKLLGDHTEGTYNPWATDRDAAVEGLRTTLARYRGTYRELSDFLDGGTGWATEGGRFLPVLPPLDLPATRDDVTAGRAHFHLDSPGPKPAMRTPFGAEWLARPSAATYADGQLHGREVVVLQVERDAQGALWFGIADGNGFFVVSDNEIGMLRSFPAAAESR